MSQGFYGFPNILGLLRATNLRLTGKAGATAGAGLAGGTTSGAPTSGAFDVGDLVIGADGTLFVCTVAGAPGTWVQPTGAAGAAGANFTIGGIPSVRAYNNANIATSHATLGPLSLNSTRYDQGTSTPQHSTSSNTSRLVCQQAGVYHISGSVIFAANTTGDRLIGIRLNGTTELARQRVQTVTTSGADTDVSVDTEYLLAVGDYVELQTYQASSTTLNVLASGNISPEFMMTLIA